MSIRRSRFGSKFAVLGAALALSAVVAPPASAGMFDSLFGSRPRPSLPPQAMPYSAPLDTPSREHRPSGDVAGPATSFCVRTCDGRFFPIPRQANATPAELCQSFCPASQTVIFHGSKIDTAVGPKGMRYSSLQNAFVYRKRVVDNCTCNGKEPFGLARLDVKEDPTLKTGDIVATSDGLATVRNPKTAELTPINPASKLTAIKVAPPSRSVQSAR